MSDEELIAWLRDLNVVLGKDAFACAADRLEEYARAFANLQREYDARGERIEVLVKERDALIEWNGQASVRAERAEARVQRLEKALEKIAAEASVTVHTWKNGINFKKMYEGWRKIATERIDIARAALKGDDHE